MALVQFSFCLIFSFFLSFPFPPSLPPSLLVSLYTTTFTTQLPFSSTDMSAAKLCWLTIFNFQQQFRRSCIARYVHCIGTFGRCLGQLSALAHAQHCIYRSGHIFLRSVPFNLFPLFPFFDFHPLPPLPTFTRASVALWSLCRLRMQPMRRTVT